MDSKAFELLAAIIQTEEASLEHWSNCRVCGPTPTCPEGRGLMAEHIQATLAGKIYIDRVRKGVVFA